MPRPPAVAPVPSSTPVQVQSKTGLFQSIKEGFGFGVGTSIARSMFGQSESAAPSAPAAPPSVAAPLATPPSVAALPSVVSPSQEKQKKVTFDLVYTQCMLEGGSEDFCKQLSETLN